MALNTPTAVTVSTVAVLVLAANPRRRFAVLQQTTANAVRLGGAGVTAATGMRLGQNERLELREPNCPTDAIFAIREGGSDGAVIAFEVG